MLVGAAFGVAGLSALEEESELEVVLFATSVLDDSLALEEEVEDELLLLEPEA